MLDEFSNRKEWCMIFIPLFIIILLASLVVGAIFLLYAVFVILVGIGHGFFCFLEKVTNKESALWVKQGHTDKELLKYINKNHLEFVSRLVAKGYTHQEVYQTIADLQKSVNRSKNTRYREVK
jgi:hypothetical protein